MSDGWKEFKKKIDDRKGRKDKAFKKLSRTVNESEDKLKPIKKRLRNKKSSFKSNPVNKHKKKLNMFGAFR